MISRYQHRALTWVDLESPNEEEIAHIMEEFSLPHVLANELVTNTLRSKVDLYENVMYVILHFPLISHSNGKVPEQEVDFIIGKDFLITARYEPIGPIQRFAKIFEVNAMLDKHRAPHHGGIVFMQLLKELYQHSLLELESTTETLQSIEEQIFSGKEKMVVRTISSVGRKLLDFRQAVRFHKDILVSYESAAKKFFGDEYGYYASTIIAEYNKVDSLLEGHRETLSELQRTNDSLLTTKTNEIMKMFTVMTFVMVPLTLITSVFGMNSEFVFIKTINDFYFVIGTMTVTGLIMFLFFRLKKWL